MIINNKKGDFMLSILLIILLLVLFFLLAPSLNTVINDVVGFTSDTTVQWMLRGFTFILLAGILKYVLTLGGSEQ